MGAPELIAFLIVCVALVGLMFYQEILFTKDGSVDFDKDKLMRSIKRFGSTIIPATYSKKSWAATKRDFEASPPIQVQDPRDKDNMTFVLVNRQATAIRNDQKPRTCLQVVDASAAATLGRDFQYSLCERDLKHTGEEEEIASQNVTLTKKGKLQVERKVSCFNDGTDIPQNDIKATSASSAELCQALCQEETSCKFFAWNKTSQQCWLKSLAGKSNAQADTISGPKMCDTGSSNFLCMGLAGTRVVVVPCDTAPVWKFIERLSTADSSIEYEDYATKQFRIVTTVDAREMCMYNPSTTYMTTEKKSLLEIKSCNATSTGTSTLNGMWWSLIFD